MAAANEEQKIDYGSFDPTPVEAILPAIEELRRSFKSGITRPVANRVAQLRNLRRFLQVERKAIHEALNRDLRQTAFLADIAELEALNAEIDLAIDNVYDWVKPTKRSVPAVNLPASAYTVPEPLGVALVIAPWNYPLRLCLAPAVGAIAAGNTVMIKPSEVTPHVSALLYNILPKYVDQTTLRVVQGAVPETTELLRHRFDHIFYTGNSAVGRIVMRAAAEYLTPVTLELGGKSPVIVDENVDLPVAVKRIVWGKTMNCGQTCVAPDYLLVHENIRDKFVDALKRTLVEMYGENAQNSPDFSRIVNERHVQRLTKLLGPVKDKVVYGGKIEPSDRYVEPTLILDPSLDTPLMKEEIFGPLLPIVTIKSVDQAIDFVNEREKPLALYVFSKNQKTVDAVLQKTSSGGVGVNETIMHIVCPDMHFGGVGESGIGGYNGRHTFDTFSHQKPVLDHATFVDPFIRYAPYTSFKQKAMVAALNFGLPTWATTVAKSAAVAGVALAVYQYRLSIAKFLSQ